MLQITGLVHAFSVDIARELGVHAAIIHGTIAHWVNYNASEEKNFHDGKYWMYDTIQKISDRGGYLSRNQVKVALNKLTKSGLIEKGCYNQKPYDRTLWYTIGDICPMERTQISTRRDTGVPPIPGTKPLLKPNTPPIVPQEGTVVSDVLIMERLTSLLQEINAKLPKSRYSSPNACKRKFKSLVKDYGIDELCTAISDFYKDKKVSEKNYEYAPAVIRVLNKEKFAAFLSEEKMSELKVKNNIFSAMSETGFRNIVKTYLNMKTWNNDVFGFPPDHPNTIITDEQKRIFSEMKNNA